MTVPRFLQNLVDDDQDYVSTSLGVAVVATGKFDVLPAYVATFIGATAVIDSLPRNNSITVSVKGFKDSITNTPITDDTTLTFTIYNSAGAAVSGLDAVVLVGDGFGNYYATASLANLTLNADYSLVVTGTAYPVQWSRDFRAKKRSFTV